MDFLNWAQNHESGDLFSRIFSYSPAEFMKRMKRMKEARSRNKKIETLQTIAANYVVDNRHLFRQPQPDFFLSSKKPLFANLSNDVVQNLMNFAEKRIRKSDSDKVSFMLQLLNAQVTKFDVEARSSFLNFLPDSCNTPYFFKHLLQNCPNIQKIDVPSRVWNDQRGVLPRLYLDDLFPLMAHRWKDLNNLALDVKNVVFDKETEIKIGFGPGFRSIVSDICLHLPNLKSLSLDMYLKNFTTADVTSLSRMKLLEDLQFTFYGKGFKEDRELALIVHTAGRTPHLKNFGFNFEHEFESRMYCESKIDFLREYGSRYPKKRITLDRVGFMDEDLDFEWPSCVRVNELELIDLDSLENLSNLEGPVQKLHLANMDLNFVYYLVHRYGTSGITHLMVIMSDEYGDDGDTINLCRVLSYCKNLQHVDFMVHWAFSGYDETKKLITPATFENCKSFKVHVVEEFYKEHKDIICAFKMYLLGSSVYHKKLEVRSMDEIKAIQLALLEKNADGNYCKTCIDKLEEMHIIVAEFTDESINGAMKVFTLLFQRSCFLREFVVTDGKSDKEPPEWLPKYIEAFGVDCDGMLMSTSLPTSAYWDDPPDFNSGDEEEGFGEEDESGVDSDD